MCVVIGVNVETVVIADLDNPDHAEALIYLLNEYAKDEMGGGAELTAFAKTNLVSAISKRPHMAAILAFVEGEPAGLAICVEGFSTFSCKPLLNIHDLVVTRPFRGRKLSHRLLEKAEALARDRHCCKLTLEVLEGNVVAQHSYRSFGFESYELDPKMGKAMFWQKAIV